MSAPDTPEKAVAAAYATAVIDGETPDDTESLARAIIARLEAAGWSLVKGAVTEWGLKLTAAGEGSSGVPVFERYPGKEDARASIGVFQGPFDVVLVSRQAGPWTEVPEVPDGPH